MVSNKKTKQDYIDAGLNRGIIWIGNSIDSVLSKTQWRCNNGHEWEASFANITHKINPTGCPFCSKKASNGSEYYVKSGLEKGLSWIGDHLPKSLEKTLWKCNTCGYEWESVIGNIRKNNGCPSCNRRAKLTKQDYENLANLKGIKWVGIEIVSVNSKTSWECKKGHHWNTSYNSLKNTARSGCLECSKGLIADSVRLDQQRYYELEKTTGFKLIKKADKTTDNCTWECKKGHQWNASYHNVKHGTGCPYCVNIINGTYVSKPQYAVHALIGGILNYSLLRYSIDIGIPDKKIAIEYDSWYWHAKRMVQDQKKTDDILNAGWKLIRIKSDSLVPDKATIEDAIGRLDDTNPYQEIVLADWGFGNINSHQEKKSCHAIV